MGAAIAMVVGAGGIGIVDATRSSGERTVFVPITSCRLTDTRSTQVDARATPLGPGETYVLTAHGTNGDCTGIPTDAVGLQLNMTALGATETTFWTVWGDGAQPNASSLNPEPGQPPTPNAVTTDLTATGQFNVFNAFGTVDAIVDITGYYTDHNHDDRYYTEAEADGRFAPIAHTHDDRYFTEAEVNAKLSGSYTCGAADFFPDVNTTPYGGGIKRVYPAAVGVALFICSIHVPAGATVTAFEVAYIDQDTSNGACTLLRATPAGGTEILSGTGFTNGSSATPQIMSGPIVANAEVLADRPISLRCTLADDLGITYAKVEYTVT